MSDIYLCIHGHFYQPPRENPWLGVIEVQPTARPFHDWNERITRECYSPNGWARVLDEKGRISRLINNYEYMSFNFGPTLLSWVAVNQPKTYRRILAADAASRERLSGHGNALAQVYNHIIMPLADSRDKLTQIRWGKSDFRSRFGRDPEGMWLAETAVDLETLDLMAREGISFTILSPVQARMIRPLNKTDDASWVDVSGERIDPRQPYRVFTDKSGKRHMDLFFYDGPVSRGIAYERLLNSGPGFLSRIEMAAGSEMSRPRLVNLATDGESYGHHFPFGEMALSWLIDHIEKEKTIHPINYGAFLEQFPPEYEVMIYENSSWSCAHGVERWRSDCGCHIQNREGWNQAWRTPLRKGLNRLRDGLADVFEEQGRRFFPDPWAARDDFISVILDPSPVSKKAFLARNSGRALDETESAAAIALLESQKMSQFMFTSCAWFFDDIAGIESRQNMTYAARAIEQVKEFSTGDLQSLLLDELSQAVSNEPHRRTGAQIYQRAFEKSRPSVDLMVAHYGLRRLVDERDTMKCLVSAAVESKKSRRLTGPGITVLAGEVNIPKTWNGREAERVFIALHQGGLALECLVGPRTDGFSLTDLAAVLDPLVKEVSPHDIKESFMAAVPEATTFTLNDLFPDSRHNLAWTLAQEMQRNFREWIRDFFDTHQDLLLLLEETRESETDVPGVIYRMAIGHRLEKLLEKAQGDDGMDWSTVRTLAEQAKKWGVAIDAPGETYRGTGYVRQKIEKLAKKPGRRAMARLIDFLELATDLKLNLDLWASQNRYSELYHDPEFRARLKPKMEETFLLLGKTLNFQVTFPDDTASGA